jgi:cell division protein FtsB
MKKEKQLGRLAQLTQMNFEARSSEMQALSARQDRLRERFKLLERQRLNAMSASDDDALGQRLTGVDVLYQVWIGRQLTSVNSELAQLRVEQEARLRELKTAFGKKEAVAKLLRRQKELKRPGAQDW